MYKHVVSGAASCLFSLFGASLAQGATFCVGSAAALQSALTTAGSNGEGDVIKIKSGIYAASSSPFTYSAAPSESFSLSISGGYSDVSGVGSCLPVLPASSTIIDGQNLRRGLVLNSLAGDGDIEVSRLTIIRGFSSTDCAGMDVGGAAGWNGWIRVDRVQFASNRATTFGGGLCAATGFRQAVSNSLFHHNQAGNSQAAADLIALGGVSYFTNNTVVDNSCSPGAPATCVGGVRVAGPAGNSWRLWNSVFDSNQHSDWFSQINYEISRTALQAFTGTLPSAGSPLNVPNPGFVDASASNYRLRPESPLLDAGDAGLLTNNLTNDLDESPRVDGDDVDIGAFELQYLLFRDGFEG